MFFVVRVVLHRIDNSEDYTDLHKEMRNKGFSRTIIGTDQKTYRLPPAEYFIEHDTLTSEEVHNLAEEAVNNVLEDETAYIQRENKQPTILVSTATNITWSGLSKVFVVKGKKTS